MSEEGAPEEKERVTPWPSHPWAFYKVKEKIKTKKHFSARLENGWSGRGV
jgi:hypothetical protein